MARPESIDDIELTQVEFATVETDKFTTHGPILKAYATFMESLQKAGVEVEASSYGRVIFRRFPYPDEQASQLHSAQVSWDERQKQYNQLRDVGALEYDYMRSSVERWARDEGLPWPPVHEPIDNFDAVIRDIDAAVAE